MYVKSPNVGLRTPAYGIRREARYAASIPVSVTRFLRFGPSVTRGMSLDVSRSGMSLLVCGAPLVGETVLITPQSKAKPFELLGAVRHSTEAKSGVEFYPLSAGTNEAIKDWIEELEREGELLGPDVRKYFEN